MDSADCTHVYTYKLVAIIFKEGFKFFLKHEGIRVVGGGRWDTGNVVKAVSMKFSEILMNK